MMTIAPFCLCSFARWFFRISALFHFHNVVETLEPHARGPLLKRRVLSAGLKTIARVAQKVKERRSERIMAAIRLGCCLLQRYAEFLIILAMAFNFPPVVG